MTTPATREKASRLERLEEDVPLAPLCTLEVGGPARFLVRCRGRDDLRHAVAWARHRDLEIFFLGGGSNLLVADAGFDGLVVALENDGLEIAHLDALSTRVRAGAGLEWDRLVTAAIDAGLGGIECLSGIPGRVGAAPIQNIGAYGQELAETLVAVEALEIATGREILCAAAECGLAYRDSHFKSAWRGRYAVLAIELRLPRIARGTPRYPELRRRLGLAESKETPTAGPSLIEIRQAVLDIRRDKSMVLDPTDPNRRSAGSFFTNPLVSPAVAADLRRRFGEDMPSWPTAEGQVKLSAAWLIERAGIRRGQKLGRAAVSTRHCLALVNRGGASAAEILTLAGTIRDRVHELCGIVLEPEPTMLGFGDEALPAISA